MIMIDVLNKLAKGEIKDKTVLNVYDYINCIGSYTFDGKAFRNEYDKEIGSNFNISSMFLNYTVELIEPKPKKYYLRLYEDDSFSYINKHKIGCSDYKTKFTQEEIEESMLLKFIEQHGIKEEVDET